jgi:hypothetical protein
LRRSTQNSARSRVAARIGKQLDNTLIAYIAAASAAGVGIFALATPAEATVVYTAANTEIPANGTLALDLNNDGVVDFRFFQATTFGHAMFLSVFGSGSMNQVMYFGFSVVPSALPYGVKIPRKDFYFNSGGVMAETFSGVAKGNWKNGTHYLGLTFTVGTNSYYGWARVIVSTKHGISAVLLDYAYDDTPNHQILAGATSGPERRESLRKQPLSVPFKQAASLGLLACGAEGLAIWRREEEIQ